MVIAYWIVTIILGIVWAFVLFVPPFMIMSETPKDQRKMEFQIWAAIVAVGLIVVFAWPVVLILALPVLFVYGLYQAVRLAIKKPWRN